MEGKALKVFFYPCQTMSVTLTLKSLCTPWHIYIKWLRIYTSHDWYFCTIAILSFATLLQSCLTFFYFSAFTLINIRYEAKKLLKWDKKLHKADVCSLKQQESEAFFYNSSLTILCDWILRMGIFPIDLSGSNFFRWQKPGSLTATCAL